MTPATSYIALVPVGQVEEGIVAELSTMLSQEFRVDVQTMATLNEPEEAYDHQRNQSSSTVLLRDLVRRIPENAMRMLAVTEKDLFIPMLSFIYGQAQLGGTVSLVSLARLRQEFYTLPPNRLVLMGRLKKEAFHELGHTFGLVHCLERSCPMSLATNIRQLDLKGSEFCRACSSILRESFNAVYRHSTEQLPTEKRQ